MKKILAVALAAAMLLGISTTAMAAESQEASFTKTYEATNAGTTSPEETFEFTFAPKEVKESNANLSVEDMPAIPASTIEYEAGGAAVDATARNVAVALKDVKWPGVGIYYYTVTETQGNTAGVEYDNKNATLKVTVAYDEQAENPTETYYVAFVALTVDDVTDKEGNVSTSEKTAGFTNTYSAGDLAISKKVTGNLGDKSKYFTVKVKLTGVEGKEYAEAYAVIGGSLQANNPKTIAIGEETSFKLKHNDTITIKNLPYDVTYTVVEEDYTAEADGGYDEAKYSEFDGVINNELDEVEITNNKATVIDTGIILHSVPYVLILVLTAGAIMLMTARKRRAN